MNKILKKFLTCTLVLVMGVSVLSTSAAYAMEKATYEDELNDAIDEALKERELKGEASDESIEKLEKILSEANVPIVNREEIIRSANSGKWIPIDSTWKFRIDQPHVGGSDTGKVHLHVEGRVGKKNVESSEGVDGTPSHRTTMSKDGVPGWVQKKIKNSRQYKDGRDKQKKVKSAKAQINAKKLNLNVHKDIVIAIGIFISVVGVAIYVASEVAKWAPLLLLI